MLILTRKPGEVIAIGNNIFITIVEIKGNQIRVGIDAPKDVPVYRKEIYDQIQAENLEAAQNQELGSLDGLAAVMSSTSAASTGSAGTTGAVRSPLGQLTTAKVGVEVKKRSKK